MLRSLRAVLLAVVLIPVLSGIAFADYIPEEPDTLNIFTDPSKAPIFKHFYTPGNGMPVDLENLGVEQLFVEGFIPDTLIGPIVDKMVHSIELASRFANPPRGIAAVAASWNDAGWLTVGVIIGGAVDEHILKIYEYPLPLPQPGNHKDTDDIPVERAIFVVAFAPDSPEKYTTLGTWATGIASGPGGESASDGIDIHHPDKGPLCDLPDSLTVCIHGDLGSMCVRIRADAALTPQDAIDILRQLFGEVLEVSVAMSASMNNNQQQILGSGYETMLSFFVEGQSGCEEGDYSTACMVFEGGAGIGLPLGGWLFLTPRAMNLSSNGLWITARVMLQDPYCAEDINLASVVLFTEHGALPFDLSDYWRLVQLCDGRSYLLMKFPWDEFSQLLEVSTHFPVNCVFNIGSQVFLTEDIIKVIDRQWQAHGRGQRDMAELTGFSGKNVFFAIEHADAHARLDVFDVRGRLIATLVDEQLPAGDYDYSWNGEDSRGDRMPAGVYFYRLQVDEMETSSKFILMK